MLLEADRVTVTFGGDWLRPSRTVAVDEVSLGIDAAAPSVVAIAGESGSGKTTLARLLLGMLDPTRGAVRYEGRDLRTLSRPERHRFRREVQAVFQDPFEVYNPVYRVDHVLATPVARFGLAATRAAGRAMVGEALEAVGLRPEETLGRYPHELSGGQRQRVMVARALLPRPRVLLADEPVSMVDASLRATILDALLRLHTERGAAIVYITHDLTTAYQIARRLLILYRGVVVEAGEAEAVITRPRHPYTRLLVRSIPSPDPARRWEPPAEVADRNETDGAEAGCRFASRCPAVMPECRRAPPPAYEPEPGLRVACYLYRDAGEAR
jgi:peptide/nickel transport system ATP-binding protein